MPDNLSLEDLIKVVPNVNPEVLKELYRNGWKVEFHATSDLSHIFDDGENIPGRTDHASKTIHVATRAGGTAGILSHEIVHGAQAAIPAKNLNQALANIGSKAQTVQAESNIPQVSAWGKIAANVLGGQEKFPFMVGGEVDSGRFADTAPSEFTQMFPNFLQTKAQASATDADRSMLQSAQRMQAGIIQAAQGGTSRNQARASRASSKRSSRRRPTRSRARSSRASSRRSSRSRFSRR
jgi:hypothetical protein